LNEKFGRRRTVEYERGIDEPEAWALVLFQMGWLAILVIAMMAPLGAKAQLGASATIQGTITDSTGA